MRRVRLLDKVIILRSFQQEAGKLGLRPGCLIPSSSLSAKNWHRSIVAATSDTGGVCVSVCEGYRRG